MTERSVLRVRNRPHFHPDRRNETVVEVLRGGEVVATIYGSREGIHVVSGRGIYRRPFMMETEGGDPTWALPLMTKDEICPWCDGSKMLLLGPDKAVVCPVCENVTAI